MPITYREIVARGDAYVASYPEAKPLDRCMAMIAACIDDGIDERRRIVGAIHTAYPKFSPKFVGFVLTRLTGTIWKCGPEHCFTMI